MNLTDDAGPADYAAAIDACAGLDGVDSLIVLHNRPAFGSIGHLSDASEVPAVILRAAAEHPDLTMLACLDDATSTCIEGEEGTSVPVFAFAERAAKALGRLAEYQEWRAVAEAQGDSGRPSYDADSVAAVVAAELERGGGAAVLVGPEAQESLLGSFGVHVVARRFVDDVDAAVAAADEVGWPVVLKAQVRDRTRRSVRGGVVIDIVDAADLRATWPRLSEAVGANMVPAVVQRFVDQGIDVAVRVRRDEAGAGTIEVGLGGPATLHNDWRLGVLPLTLADASVLVAGSAVGTAITDPLDRVQIVSLVHRLAVMAEEVEEVRSIEANPILTTATAAWVADVAIELGPPVGEFTVRRLD